MNRNPNAFKEQFGSNVFNDKARKEYLSKEAYDEDADIEWCYASLRCGTPDAYTLSRLAAHEPSLDETTAEAEWLLLHGLHKRLHDVEASRVLIARALELDPELAARAEFAD